MTDYYFKFRISPNGFRLHILEDETMANALANAKAMLNHLNAKDVSLITKEMYEVFASSSGNLDRDYDLAKRLRRYDCHTSPRNP